MTTRTPIAPSEIRVGDRVAAVSHGMETTFVVDHFDNGRIYASAGNAHHDSEAFLQGDKNEWFLLDRPTPPVALPTEPTLGWARVENGVRAVGIWSTYTHRYNLSDQEAVYLINPEREFAVSDVVEFIPGTLVPTSALDALRKAFKGISIGSLLSPCEVGVRTFLADVDSANR